MEIRLKRFLSLALALLMVFSLMPQITIGAEAASGTTTLYCVAPDGWTKCNVYAWNSSGNNTWPGMAMQQGEDGVWYADVDSSYTNVIFNNGSGTQSEDLTMPTDDKVQYNYVAKTWSTYGASVEAPEAEYVTVYCNATWSNANAYWWGSSIENPGWPGVEMTKGTDGLWAYAVPEDATGLIFNNIKNNSGTQTADLTVPTGSNVQYNVSTSSWGAYTPVVEEEVVPTVTLNGAFNDWKGVNMIVEGSVATYTMELEAGSYEFKVIEDGTWLGNTGTIEDTTETTSAGKGWEFKSSDGGNCTLKATGGTYTFSFNTKDNFLIITHQAPHEHSYEYECSTECSTCDEGTRDASHDFEDAEGNALEYCEYNCGTKNENYVAPHEHSYEYECSTECSTCDEGTRDASHKYVEGTCKYCETECKHNAVDMPVTKEPTCSETGLKNVVCGDCGHVVEEDMEIPATGEHTFAGEDGEALAKCSVCGTPNPEYVAPVVVAKIGDETYATFDEAMGVANAMTGDVVVEIHGEVEFVNGMELNGSYDSISFVGKTENAKITINQSAGGDYLTAHGKTVAFTDLILAKANPAWAGNSGHMGNYFSVQGGTVTYTNCTFSNGACTSGGTATYNSCTFQNGSEYGLWVYDDALVTVNGGTIDSTKGIKVYSEDEGSVTSTLKVQNATFTEKVNAKPAVAIGYAESITLIGNTYNNPTGEIELDSGTDADCEGVTFVAQDAEGNDIAAEMSYVDRSNSNAACGVLMDGKIYTSVTDAAAEAEEGVSVTVLYNTEEEAVFPADTIVTTAKDVSAPNVTVAVYAAYIGTTGYDTVADAFAAAVDGDEVKINVAGTYAPAFSGKDITVTGTVDGVVFDNIGAYNMGGASVTFNNVTFDYLPNTTYTGLQAAGDLVYNNCTINGTVFLYGTSETFNNCTFNVEGDAYNVWTYAADEVAFNNCTFNSNGKSVLVYNEGDGATDLTVTDTKFNANGSFDGKAAIEIDTSLMPEGTEIVVDDKTTAGGFATGSVSGSTLWNDKKADPENTNGGGTNSSVTVAGEVVKEPVHIPVGTVTPAYTTTDRFWGEATSNSKESLVIELYEGETKIGSSTLNSSVIGNKGDGSTNVTWSLKFNDTSSNWTYEWAEGYPNINMAPDTVKLVVDGTVVATNVVKWSAPDDVNKIVALAEGFTGGVKAYTSLADALAAAKDGDQIDLVWSEGREPIAMNGAVFGKSVTITGTATVDWSKGFLFVGRGGEGNGTVTFDNANLTSASNSASYGIHVSGREKGTDNKYDGTLIIKNSTIELDYLINKGSVTMEGSTLTVKNGFSVGGRPASETESGEDATAYMNLTNGSKLIVGNHNGMGVGYEALGVMNIDGTSTFECEQNFLITEKGTVNVNGGKVVMNGKTLTVKGTLESTGDIDANIVAGDNAKITISAGTYTQDVTEWCANGYTAKDNGDGTWTVRADREAMIIGSTGVKYYETLAEAVEAAKDGETIIIQANIVISDVLTVDKNLTIADYGALKISYTGNGAFHITEDHALTLDKVILTAPVFADSTDAGATVNSVVVTGTSEYKSTVTSDGTTVTVTNPDWLVEVGDAYYMSLSAAVAAANNGDTVKILTDVTLSNVITVEGKAVTITADESVTITANITDTVEYDFFTVGEGGKLTLGENLTVNSDTSILWAHDGGEIVVDGATLKSTSTEYAAAAVYANSKLTVLSGSIEATANSAISVNGVGAVATISGGEVKTTCEATAYCAVFARYGTAEVTGTGTVSAAAGYGLVAVTDGTVKVSGGTVNNGVKAHENDKANAVITGGVVNGTLSAANGATLTVSGGTFDQDPAEYCADGYTAISENGVYKVVEAPAKFIIEKTNMRFGSDLSLLFAFKQSNLISTEGVYAEIVRMANGTAKAPVQIASSDWTQTTISGEKYYVMEFDGFAAKEMTDEVTVVIRDAEGNALSEALVTSIRTYAMDILGKTTNAEYKTAIVDMLNYGAAAQSYFDGYNANELANKLLTDDQKALASGEGTYEDKRVKDDAYFGGSNLRFVSKINLIFRLNISEDTYAVFTWTDHSGNAKSKRVDSSAYATSGGMYVVELDELVVADARQLVTCTIYNSSDNTEVTKVIDSVESNAARGTGAVSELYVAFMKFADSAYAYMH